MSQVEMFEKKDSEQLKHLVNDLVRKGKDHSRLSDPILVDNIKELSVIKKENPELDDIQLRVLLIKKWLTEGAELDDIVSYRIANLGTKEAIDLALEHANPHTIGKAGQSIATRVFSRYTTYVPTLIEHPKFKWNMEQSEVLIGWLLDKKAHAPLNKLLKSENNGFDYIVSDGQRDFILNKFCAYIDNSPRSSSVDFNSGRMIDIFYEEEWNLQAIHDKLDKSHWGKFLKAMVEEKWMLKNIPEKENTTPASKTMKF